MTTFFVDQAKAAQLYLRKGVKPADVIAVLPAGTEVDKLDEVAGKPVWWKVRATLPNAQMTGFLHSGFLSAGKGVTLAPISGLPACHLPPSGHRRRDGFGQAFPLDDASMPSRKSPDASQTLAILGYLQPDNGMHLRYKPGSGKTYCNIYAYDFAQRMGVFLPRVWWTSTALIKISNGQPVAVAYGTSVTELNANALHDWLAEHGDSFGWQRVFAVGDLQKAANDGKACLIVAKRKDTNRSGHIVAVAPETPSLKAASTGGTVTRPVQSQAGSVNFTAAVPGTRWWLDIRFQSFGFWMHD